MGRIDTGIMPGHVLCDMHEGTKQLRIAHPYRLRSMLTIPAPGGSRMITEALKAAGDKRLYLNKLLVVYDVDPRDDNTTVLKAAFSYDDRSLGLAEIIVVPDLPCDARGGVGPDGARYHL